MDSKNELITFIKFTLVGILGAGVGSLIIMEATHRLPPEASPYAFILPYLLSVEAGILVTFYPNDVWVFRKEKYKLTMWQRLVAYHIALFGGFVVQTLVFGVLLILSLPIKIAYFGGVGGAALWNYLVSRKAVFAEEGGRDENSGIRSRISGKRLGSNTLQKK
ncbi:putative membrane protein [Aciduliprofundum sp. MAR08-339]|uniref:GtrA family protein n=1 Tax=Aciduliprofundum sp. (strain MAR08-339) TaxID=673860 RepID=UPI0002A4991D|nr:putative membrane protein [Aciduliprofundum sp. MAR08-339]